MNTALQMIEFLIAVRIKKTVFLKDTIQFIMYVGIFSGTFSKSLMYLYQINYAM